MHAPQTESPLSASHLRHIVAATHIGFVLVGITATMLGPILPLLAARWKLSDTELGYLSVMQFVGSMTGTALSSPLSARFGMLRTLIFGALAMAVGASGFGLSVWPFVAAMVLLYGIGLGLTIPTTNFLIAELYPINRAARLNVLNFAWGLGAALSALTVGWTARNYGTARPLVMLGMLLIGIALWLLRCARIGIASPVSPSSTDKPNSVWRNPFLGLLSLLAFCYVGTESAIAVWVATYAQRMDASADAWWTVAPTFFLGAILAGRRLAPLFLRVLTAEKLLLAGLLLALPSIGLLLWTNSIVILLTAVFFCGLGFAAIYPNLVAILSQQFGTATAKAGSVVFTIAGLGGAVLPGLVGRISDEFASLRAGLLVALAGNAVMLAVQVVLMAMLRRRAAPDGTDKA